MRAMGGVSGKEMGLGRRDRPSSTCCCAAPAFVWVSRRGISCHENVPRFDRALSNFQHLKASTLVQNATLQSDLNAYTPGYSRRIRVGIGPCRKRLSVFKEDVFKTKRLKDQLRRQVLVSRTASWRPKSSAGTCRGWIYVTVTVDGRRNFLIAAKIFRRLAALHPDSNGSAVPYPLVVDVGNGDQRIW